MVAQTNVTPLHGTEFTCDPIAPLATDDPFTWLPWLPQEDTGEDEEHEPSVPQDPQHQGSEAEFPSRRCVITLR
jgi:hypothetical protein